MPTTSNAGDNPQHGMSTNDKTVRYGALAIVLGLTFPPAGMVYAYRCWREARSHGVPRGLAYVAGGFVGVGLVTYSLIFAALTNDFPLIVQGA